MDHAPPTHHAALAIPAPAPTPTPTRTAPVSPLPAPPRTHTAAPPQHIPLLYLAPSRAPRSRAPHETAGMLVPSSSPTSTTTSEEDDLGVKQLRDDDEEDDLGLSRLRDLQTVRMQRRIAQGDQEDARRVAHAVENTAHAVENTAHAACTATPAASSLTQQQPTYSPSTATTATIYNTVQAAAVSGAAGVSQTSLSSSSSSSSSSLPSSSSLSSSKDPPLMRHTLSEVLMAAQRAVGVTAADTQASTTPLGSPQPQTTSTLSSEEQLAPPQPASPVSADVAVRQSGSQVATPPPPPPPPYPGAPVGNPTQALGTPHTQAPPAFAAALERLQQAVDASVAQVVHRPGHPVSQHDQASTGQPLVPVMATTHHVADIFTNHHQQVYRPSVRPPPTAPRAYPIPHEHGGASPHTQGRLFQHVLLGVLMMLAACLVAYSVVLVAKTYWGISCMAQPWWLVLWTVCCGVVACCVRP